MNRISLIVALLFAILAGSRTLANPDFRTVETVAGLQVVRDDKEGQVRYYFPYDLRLASSNEGRPELEVLETRYRGTAATGDAGKELFSSLLHLALQISPSPASALSEARNHFGARTELRPLPLQRISLAIMHLPIGGPGPAREGRSDDKPHVLPAGVADGGQDESHGDAEAVWSEHHETVRLDPESAQLLADSWRQGRLLLSIGYTLYSAGIAPDASLARLEGSPEMIAELKRLIPDKPIAQATATNTTLVLVRTGALGISIDAARWPDNWKRHDLNEGAPPGYPLLDVRCYDFADAAAGALYEKHLVIEADSVAGAKITTTVRFQRRSRENSAQWVRFPIGIRLDRPYRYRTESIFENGSSGTTPWATNSVWSQLIDISEKSAMGDSSLITKP